MHADFCSDPERKVSLGRSRLRRQDDIELDFNGLGCEVVNWICLPDDRIKCTR